MEYIITSLEKSEGGRYCICLDDHIRFWLYRSEIRKCGLESGGEVTQEQYQEILHGILGKRAIKRAMHLLERQDKTEYQLRDKLRQSEYPKEAIEDAIDYVKRYHYLDDERYAKTFVLFHQNKRSRMRLAMDLQRRGIPRDVIESALEEVFAADETQQMRELLEKRHFPQNPGDEKEFRKNYQFLVRRGFKSNEILRIMRDMRDGLNQKPLCIDLT